jgi:hypothetical protein
LRDLNTRIVAPLLPFSEAPKPAQRLNPVFEIEGERYTMVTQFLAAVPVAELGRRMGTLIDEDTRIIGCYRYPLRRHLISSLRLDVHLAARHRRWPCLAAGSGGGLGALLRLRLDVIDNR